MNMKSILVVLASLVACSVAHSQKTYDDYWTKLNTRPVCFEGKNRKPGIFRPLYKGFLAAVKLVRRSGQITCNDRRSKHYSYWGCHQYPPIIKTPLTVFITDSKNRILFPRVGAKFTPGRRWYSVHGFDSRSSNLVLQHGFSVPLYLGPKSKLRIWYGEDLFNYGIKDNRGRVCADVYGYFL